MIFIKERGEPEEADDYKIKKMAASGSKKQI